MAKGISIGIASDTRDFKRGVDSGVIDPLDGVKDVLEDVVKAGDKAGHDLNETFLKQQQTTKDLRKDYKNLNDEISEGSRKSSQTTRQHVQDTTRETSESLKTVKQESLANASETFSSFDGSAQSFADGLQGIFGGVIADLGPLGAAAGAAGALGIGLISTAIQNGTEDTAEFKQSVNDLATDLISTGTKGSASLGKIVDQLQTLAEGGDDAGTTLEKLRKIADTSGSSYKDLAQAYAGNGAGLDALVKKNKRLYDQMVETESQNNRVGSTYQQLETKTERARDAQDTYVQYLEKAQKQQKLAAQQQADYIRSGAADLELQADANQSYADSVQSAYQEAGASISDFVKDGKFNLDDYQKKTEENAQAIVDYQANIATATADLAKGGHDKAIQYLEQLGPDAAPLIAAFIKAPEAQKASLENTWDTLGGAASTSFGSSLQKHLDSTPAKKTVDVDFRVDDSALRKAIAAQQGADIGVNLVPNGGQKRVY